MNYFYGRFGHFHSLTAITTNNFHCKKQFWATWEWTDDMSLHVGLNYPSQGELIQSDK